MDRKTVWYLMAGVVLGLALELSGYLLAPWFIAAFVMGYIAMPVYVEARRQWYRWRYPATAYAATMAAVADAEGDDDAGDHDS